MATHQYRTLTKRIVDRLAVDDKAQPQHERFLNPEELGRLGRALDAAPAERLASRHAAAAIRLLVLTGCRPAPNLLTSTLRPQEEPGAALQQGEGPALNVRARGVRSLPPAPGQEAIAFLSPGRPRAPMLAKLPIRTKWPGHVRGGRVAGNHRTGRADAAIDVDADGMESSDSGSFRCVFRRRAGRLRSVSPAEIGPRMTAPVAQLPPS